MDVPNSLVIRRGVILHSTIFKQIDHGKFFVIIGEDEKNYIGLFFINSNISFFNSKPALLKMQYPICKKDYNFLKHDSFLCCTEITTLNKKELSISISNKITMVKGFLQDEHLKDILNLVRTSNLFSDKEKKTFFK